VTGLEPKEQRPANLTDKELADLDADLAGADAAKAFRAMGMLVNVPKQAVPFLQQRLQPVPVVDAARLDGLIKDLASKEADVAKQATDELGKLAELAEPALRKALAGNPPQEFRQRIEPLLKRLDGTALSVEQLRMIRSVEILEAIATPEARKVLESAAQGAPGARLTREAQAAVQRLGKRAGN
jgi:hypothetical protein